VLRRQAPSDDFTVLEEKPVDRIHRQSIMLAVVLAVVLAPMGAMAQSRGARNPIFIAVTFKSPAEPKLGVEVAEAIRLRMIRQFPQPPRVGQLRVVTGEQVNSQLTNAGYSADSAISTAELRELGKSIGADESLEGTITRTAGGVTAQARFYSLNQIVAAEVLPPVTEKNAEAAGKKIAEMYIQARKELPDYEKCRNALIARQPHEAIAYAKASLMQYERGILPRACLMSAYFDLARERKMPLDSVIRVGLEIVAVDPDNEVAIGILADAYTTKADTAKAVAMNMKLFALNPTNTNLATSIISTLMQAGAPQQARTVVQTLLESNPGDAAILDMNWRILQAMRDWKGVLAAGEEMIKADTARADTTFFVRQLAAAVSDSQPRLVLEYLGRATAKFPTNIRFWLGYSQELNRQGQTQQALDAAKKAVALDPKVDNGYAMILSLYAKLGQADSAIAFARQAIAAGADKASIGNALLTLINPAQQKATTSNSREDWSAVYAIASIVDSLAPSKTTKFFVGLGAAQIAFSALGQVSELQKTDKPKACAELKIVEDLFLVAELTMPEGGSVSPPAAAQILNVIGQQKPNLPAYKKVVCVKPLS
jgi:tetratricopeptide (TPR) repeat protein